MLRYVYIIVCISRPSNGLFVAYVNGEEEGTCRQCRQRAGTCRSGIPPFHPLCNVNGEEEEEVKEKKPSDLRLRERERERDA